MEKIINISGHDTPFKATAGTVRRYRQRFGRDLLVDMQSLSREVNSGQTLGVESLTIFENLAYTMAKHADPTIPDDPDEWLDAFDMFSIYFVLPEIIELWNLSQTPASEQKKKQD